MTDILQGLVAYIEANVTAAGKGYPLEVPQDANYPAWSYELVDDERLIAHDGKTSYSKARIQIDVMDDADATHSGYYNTRTATLALRNALDGFSGNLGGVTVEFCKTSVSDGLADAHNLPYESFDAMIQYLIQ